MNPKLKVLQFANKPPYPPLDGGAIGMNNVSYALIDRGHQLKLFSVNTSKHFVDFANLPSDYINSTQVELHFVDTELKVFDAFLNLFSNKSYHITRFFDESLKNRLVNYLTENEVDIIIIESIFLIEYLPYIRAASRAKVILRAPNIEHLIWERLAAEAKNPLKKIYLSILSSRLKRAEMEAFNSFDGFFTVTEKDLNFFKNSGVNISGTYIPTGLDVEKEKMLSGFQKSVKPFPTVFHLGALDWMPNQEGIIWFLNKVWPMVEASVPEAKLHIAGRRPFKELYEFQSDRIFIEGEVSDAGAFINEHDIMIVPLFSGSGMRVKIIEGMMMGKAIVTTGIGAEGLKIRDGHDVLIADDAEKFADAIVQIYQNQSLGQRLSANAITTSKAEYSNDLLAEKLEEFLLSFSNKMK